MSFVHALSGSYFAKAPVGGATAKYYRYLGRFSRALAFCADIAMLRFGGDLKRREMLSARLGDVLSHLYLASAVLKRYQDEGHQHADLPFVQYSVERSLYLCAKAFDEFIYNLEAGLVAGRSCRGTTVSNHLKCLRMRSLSKLRSI